MATLDDLFAVPTAIDEETEASQAGVKVDVIPTGLDQLADLPPVEQVQGALQEEELYTDQNWINSSRRVAEAVRNSADILTVVPDADASDEEIAKFGITYMGQFNYNLLNMGADVINMSTWEPEDADAFINLMQTYEKLPNFTMSGTGRLLKGVASDPTTYAGVGLLARAFGVRNFGKEAVEQLAARGIKKETAETVVRRASVYGTAALEGGIYASADDALRQAAEIQGRVRDEFSIEQNLTSTGFGVLFGTGLVGAADIGYSAYKAAKSSREAEVRVDEELATPPEQPEASTQVDTPEPEARPQDEMIVTPEESARVLEEAENAPTPTEFNTARNQIQRDMESGLNLERTNEDGSPRPVVPRDPEVEYELPDGSIDIRPTPIGSKNLSRLETTDDVKRLVQERAVRHEAKLVRMDGYNQGTQTLEQAEREAKEAVLSIARELGEETDRTGALFEKLKGEAKDDIKLLRTIQARALAINEIMTETAQRLTQMVRTKSADQFTNAEKAEFMQLKDVLDSLSLMDGLYSRQFSRNLGSRRVTRGTWAILDALNDPKLKRSNQAADEFAVLHDAVKASYGNIKLMRQNTKPNALFRVIGRLNSFRTEAMISGLSTQQAAGFGNILNLFLYPFLRNIAGRKIGGERGARIRAEASIQINAYRMYAKEAWEAAKVAFRLGESLTDPSSTRLEREEITFNADKAQSFLGKINVFKGQFTLFGDLMSGYDEMAKFLYTRSLAYARAYVELSRMNSELTPEQLRQQADSYVRRLADPQTGQFKDKNIVEESRKITFTQDINDGTIGQIISRVANAGGGIGRLLAFPFVKAPLNIVSVGMSMIPGTARLSERQMNVINTYRTAQKNLEDFNAGNLPDADLGQLQKEFDFAQEQFAILQAKKAVGTSIMAGSVALAASGGMTGNGPGDPVERTLWLKAGYKPLSVWNPVSKTWVSYKALEPFATPMAVAADLTYFVQQEFGGLDQGVTEVTKEILSKTLAVLVDNILGKSSLMGASQLTDALGSPDKFGTFVESFATSFIPNIARDIGEMGEEARVRENGVLLNKLAAKVPVLMNSVGYKYDDFGRPLPKDSGFLYIFPAFKEGEDVDPIQELLYDLRVQFDREGSLASMPYSLNVGTLDTDFRTIFDGDAKSGVSVYSKFHRILGEVRLPSFGNQPLYEAISDRVRDRDFAAMMYGNASMTPPAINELSGIFRAYRQTALQELREQSPAFRKKEEEFIENRKEASNEFIQRLRTGK
jgi:hypothetical protein